MSEELRDEQVAERWAVMLTIVSNQHAAPNFAWHMAEKGCTPKAIREMARRWEGEGYLPQDFADELVLFAHQMETLTGANGPVFT